MSLIDKLLGKTEADMIRDTVIKEQDRKQKQSMKIAEYHALLASCRDAFERTIKTERLNALERRNKRVGDAAQKSRIHDAAVGLLAIEEAELELRSAAQATDFRRAQKKLGFVVRQMGKLDPKSSISKKDLFSQFGFEFDDTNETEGFVERAELVDDQFVEYLIQGYEMEECMEKRLPSNTTTPDKVQYNFTSGSSEEDMEKVNRILEKNADKR